MMDIVDTMRAQVGRVWSRSEERLAFGILWMARIHGHVRVVQRAMDVIVRHNTGLVIRWAAAISRNSAHYPLEDAVQDGCLD